MGWNQVSSDKTTLLNGSSYESDFYETPTIATLAEEGIAFPYGYVNGGNCAPTRAALLSGQYAARPYNNVFTVYDLNRGNTSGNSNLIGPVMGLASNGNIDELPTEAITIAEVMKMGDYTTAHFGKYHVGEHDGAGYTEVSMNGPTRQGFDYNYGGGTDGGPGNYFSDGITFENKIGTELDPYAGNYTQSEEDALVARYPDPYPTNPSLAGEPYATLAGTPKHVSDAMAEAAMDFIGVEVLGDPINKDKPFFMHYSNFAIHGPFSDPHARPDFLVKYKAKSTSSIYDHGSNPAQGAIAEGMDQSIGRLIDYLRTTPDPRNSNKPLSENTIVYFISDNGDAIKRSPQFPLRGMKGEYYEGGIRSVTFAWTEPADPIGNPTFTPLLHNMGTVNTTPIVAFDLYPTFAEAAGIDISALPDPLNPMEIYDIDGVSQWQLLTNGTPMTRESIFWHHPGYLLDNKRDSRPVTVIRKGDYKLMHFYEDAKYELYDVVNDISETNNLLPSANPGIIVLANDMIDDMNNHLVETNAPMPTFRSDGTTVPDPVHETVSTMNSTAGCQAESGYLAYWDFDIASNANDVSANNNDPNPINGTLSYDASDFKEGDQSVVFNGSVDINYSSATFLSQVTPARTFSGWIKPTGLSGIQEIFEEGGTDVGIALRLNGSQLESRVRASNAEYDDLSAAFPNDGDWHHVALVYDGTATSHKLYIDGTEVATSNTAPSSIGTHNTTGGGIGGVIGNWDCFDESTDNYFIGKMDALAVYNSAFSEVQVQTTACYSVSTPNSTAGCQPETGYTAFYDFDASNSPITNDASGAGNHDKGVTGAVSPDFSDFKEGDQSAYFDGATKVQYNNGAFLNEEMTNRSIAVWLKPTNLSGIKNIYDEGSQLKGIGLRLNGNKIEASVRTNELSEVSLQIQGDFPNDNEWHHVVFVFKGGDYMKLYVDGIEEATSDVTFNISKKLYAGNNGGIGGVFGTDAFSETDDNANFFIGKMDAFAIYNTPLDFSAVQSMSSLWYADIDADGYGDANVSLAHCSQPLGYVSDNTDCDDTNANINPGETEIPYNGIDDDCDALTLDDDLDSDGYINANDCDDSNANINPGKTEIPYNGIDDDCNALTLDDDLDSDGYINANDCDDTNANINPGKTEIPYNGIDDDCNASNLRR